KAIERRNRAQAVETASATANGSPAGQLPARTDSLRLRVAGGSLALAACHLLRARRYDRCARATDDHGPAAGPLAVDLPAIPALHPVPHELRHPVGHVPEHV